MTANGDSLGMQAAAMVNEQRGIEAASATAVLLIRLGRDGQVQMSGDTITMGDEVRVLGLLEKLKQAVGPICAKNAEEYQRRVQAPPPGFRA